jgi:hypothetical protein
MPSQQLIGPDKLSVVQLTTGEYEVRLALWLSSEFTGGNLVQFADNATVSIEGTDELSSSYSRANWASGVASGALYAFRALRITRQRLVVTEMSGRLRSSDMDAVANGAALAIATLTERELPGLPTDGWTIQARTAERLTHATAEEHSGGERGASLPGINGGTGASQDAPTGPGASRELPRG